MKLLPKTLLVDEVILQVFSTTEGVSSHWEVIVIGSPPYLKVSYLLVGKFLNGYIEPINSKPELRVEVNSIKGNAVNTLKHTERSTLLATRIESIDIYNTLVTV